MLPFCQRYYFPKKGYVILKKNKASKYIVIKKRLVSRKFGQCDRLVRGKVILVFSGEQISFELI